VDRGAVNDLAIEVRGLGKQYQIGARERYASLRDRLARMGARLVGRRGGASKQLFAALDGIDLDVRAGEVIGLIGRNGAGKSTLLKVLARITRPTTGHALVRGRVGSLLEVGAGMHPELTGRENVYLNGVILGMGRREVARKFDEIVAFAEVGDFLDTPLKRYSSGMRVRLAFAVAAHLEPEILFVDEVLAVGDLRFQKKCLGKMGDVAEGGRTIIFVSHQMNQIRRLCRRVVWLDAGKVRADGATAESVGAYEAAMSSMQSGDGRELPAASKAAFTGWDLVDPPSGQPYVVADHGPLRVRFRLTVARPLRIRRHGIALYDSDARLLWGTAVDSFSLEPGEHEFTYALASLPLKPGSYFWKVSLFDDAGMVDIYDGVPPMLVATDPLGHPSDEWAGFLNFPYEFARSTVEPKPAAQDGSS
jgi:lipopolysaccharide transport system ATP-binding protein